MRSLAVIHGFKSQIIADDDFNNHTSPLYSIL